MKIGNKSFDSGTHIMAILNFTPDSFFDQSRITTHELLSRVKNAIEDGAEVIDIGGQSSRPGHTVINPEQEWQRVAQPISLIKSHYDIPLSVDTFYPYVAEKALQAGADMINDVWGLQYDKNGEMAAVIAKHDASVCIMHNQNHVSPDETLWDDICGFLQKSLELAIGAGISKEKIILDAGIGFGKTCDQNHTLVNTYSNLHKLGYPILLGTSRKSMFGGNVNDRLEATLKTTKQAVEQNVLFVRVHDVKENFKVIKKSTTENK